MDSSENSLEYKMCELTLASLNTVSVIRLFDLPCLIDFFDNFFLSFIRLYKIAMKAQGNWSAMKKCCYLVNNLNFLKKK